MAVTHGLSKKRKTSMETCLGAVAAMRDILDEMEEYSGIYEELTALRKHLGRIEKACARGESTDTAERDGGGGLEPCAPPMDLDGDPKEAARDFVAKLPLQRIFEDQALSDAFLSELMLALARESSVRSRREQQKKGIEKAKAQGVRFGKPSLPLPENFEEARRAWREGELSMKEASELCGMAKSTFYGAVQRAEQVV